MLEPNADTIGTNKGLARSIDNEKTAPYLSGIAQVAELVDALVSGTSAARRGGSSPLLGTTPKICL